MTNSRKTPLAAALTLAAVIFGVIQPVYAEQNPLPATADDRIAACKRHPKKCTTYTDINGTLIISGSHMWNCPPGKTYCTYIP